MKFGIFSDLHLEFAPWDFTPDPEVFYLNAGDTHPDWMVRDQLHVGVLKNKVFYVKGNHDYYGSSFRDADLDFNESIWVENPNGGTLKIAGATLWTDVTPVRWWDFKEYMMDARYIKGMNYDRYSRTHDTHKHYLFNENADIWVIHHLPSYQSVHEEYRNSNGNDFFATEMAPWILDMKKPPKLIVHGHTHKACDYMIGPTRVICHPRGYPGENEWFINYQPLIVEID
jgi:predicted phosphodiesterase